MSTADTLHIAYTPHTAPDTAVLAAAAAEAVVQYTAVAGADCQDTHTLLADLVGEVAGEAAADTHTHPLAGPRAEEAVEGTLHHTAHIAAVAEAAANVPVPEEVEEGVIENTALAHIAVVMAAAADRTEADFALEIHTEVETAAESTVFEADSAKVAPTASPRTQTQTLPDSHTDPQLAPLEDLPTKTDEAVEEAVRTHPAVVAAAVEEAASSTDSQEGEVVGVCYTDVETEVGIAKRTVTMEVVAEEGVTLTAILHYTLVLVPGQAAANSAMTAAVAAAVEAEEGWVEHPGRRYSTLQTPHPNSPVDEEV